MRTITIISASVLFILTPAGDGVYAENNIYQVWSYDSMVRATGVVSDGEYIYLSDEILGLVILGMVDSTGPYLVSIYDPGTRGFALDIRSDTIYLGTGVYEPYQGWLEIIDVSDPGVPVPIGSCTTDWEVVAVEVDTTNYAYILTYGGAKIIDISDPTTPVEVADFGGPCNVIDFYKRGNYVYLACGAGGIGIMDVSNPLNPALVGSCDTPGGVYRVAMRTSDNNHVYAAGADSALQIIDVSNPTNPQICGTFQTSDMAWEIMGQDRFVYMTLRDSGLAIVSVGDPAHPRLVGTSDVSYRAEAIGFVDGTFTQGVAVAGGSTLDFFRMHMAECSHIIGDFNSNGAVNGIDVLYGVGYFKGLYNLPLECECWSHPELPRIYDVNGNCVFNGVDVTYLLDYIKTRVFELLPCTDCPDEY